MRIYSRVSKRLQLWIAKPSESEFEVQTIRKIKNDRISQFMIIRQ